jgi:hypothetical protein
MWLSTYFKLRGGRWNPDGWTEHASTIHACECFGECSRVRWKTAGIGRGDFLPAVFAPTWDNLDSPLTRAG